MPQSGPSTRGPNVHYGAQEYADAGLLESARMKVREWWSAVLKVRDKPTYGDAQLESERAKLLGKAFGLKQMIARVMGESWSKENGLGFLPILIGAAAVLGALGYIASNLIDLKKYLDRQRIVEDTREKLIGKGVPPDQATTRAGETADKAGMTLERTFLGVPVKYYAYGAIGLGALLIFMQTRKSE